MRKQTASDQSSPSAIRRAPLFSEPSRSSATSNPSRAMSVLMRSSSAHSSARGDISSSAPKCSMRCGLTRACINSWARTTRDVASRPRGTSRIRSVRLQLASPRRVEPALTVHGASANPSSRPVTSSGCTAPLTTATAMANASSTLVATSSPKTSCAARGAPSDGAVRRRRRNCAARRVDRPDRVSRPTPARADHSLRLARADACGRSMRMHTGNRSRSDGAMSSRSSMLVVITTENCGPGRTHSLVSGLRQRADSGESVIASSVLSASPEARSTSSTTSRPPSPPDPAPGADRRTFAPLPPVLPDRHPRAGDLTRRQVLGADQSLGGTGADAVVQRGVGLARTRRSVEQHARDARRQHVGEVTPTRLRLLRNSRSTTLRLLRWESDNGRRSHHDATNPLDRPPPLVDRGDLVRS